MSNKFKIIIALFILALSGGAFYFYQSKILPDNAIRAVIPMRILINTSEGSSPTIDGEVFTPDEWRHVSEDWFQKNTEELKKYPEVKEVRVILEEKLAGVPEGELKQFIKENNLQNFAQGLKDASETYNEPLPEIVNTILKIVPYEK